MMRLLVSFLALLSTLAVTAPVDARHARGVAVPSIVTYYSLPSNRVTTWMPGLSYAPTSGQYAPTKPPAGWTGGIPNYPQYGTTYSPSGGDDTSAINGLITTACGAATQSTPKSVVLAVGDFEISGHGIVITCPYVTLVGSGPGPGMRGALVTATYVSANTSAATMLVKTDGSPYPVVTIGAIMGSGAGTLNTMYETAASTSDMVQGTNSTTLASCSSVSGMAVGEMVYVDETFDPTLTWFNESAGQGDGYLGWGEAGSSSTPATARPLGQAMEVASFNSGTCVVTFTTPFDETYRVSHSAHLGRINPAYRVNWSGVSNLFATGGGGGDGGGQIAVATCMYCWVSHIEASGHSVGQYGGALVHFFNSFRGELRDSYLHGDSLDITGVEPGGSYYNIVVDSFTSASLIENNIDWLGNKVIVMRSAGSGNVVGYNYADDGYGYDYMNQMETGLNQNHMAGSHRTLFEGNQSWQLGSESRWGSTVGAVFFRNRATGMRASAWPATFITPYPSSCATGNLLLTADDSGVYYEDGFNRQSVDLSSYSVDFSLVGNVLGYPGDPLLSSPKSSGGVAQVNTEYEMFGPSTPSSIPNNVVPIYAIGVPDGSENDSGDNHATFSATISGTTMTVTSYTQTFGGGQPLIEPGFEILTGAAAGTLITGFGTGQAWNTGTYTVSISQTVSSPTAMTAGYYGNLWNTQTLLTTIRDANFDFRSGLVHWHGEGGTASNSSTGAGGTTPPGASASGGSTLPASLYMSGPPAFFHGATWPWVDGSNAATPIPGALPALSRFQSCTPNTVMLEPANEDIFQKTRRAA